MRRRTWMLAGLTSLIATVGCSAGGRSQAKNRRRADGKRPKGPKTMGNLLVEGYIADLKNGTTESKITAARELANLGDAARPALPALEPLARHSDAKLSAAAGAAIKAIRAVTTTTSVAK